MRNWLLPEYIADILPDTARQVESAKAAMLEGFRVAGYELVLPPLIEYIDSLVSEGDVTLDLKTFKLDDQLSGRQLGLRADITPQVARIDAHLLGGRTGVTRLCYAGSVVHSRPSGLTSSREPLQVGAE
ncbi:ATP phosphoribosyltransferase regulatory subunit, partial [Pseudomonas sp. MWU12-2323]|uniref:ATP phosphoribosyltransferase regulatory subunit n=1 Tax=Pseudomonas sp. MWU12-2323 TaxID=2651296 RepID=UPI0013833320